MKGWTADLLRAAWAFFYWNVLKSWYRLRGARGRCPCHHPSDSGAAHVTGCEAVLGWARPERFRRVCPLLERGADGRWCCSVNAAKVRPFWGRAAVMGLATLVVVYLGGTLGAFGLLRARGYALSYAQVAWLPGLKMEMRRASAALFLDQMRTAYAAGRIQEAVVALTVAWQEDSTNYAAGMMLAQFRQGADPRGADAIYAHLLAMPLEPEQHRATAQVWFRSLLTRGDFAGVAALARAELTERKVEPGEVGEWLRALGFASRQLQDATPLEKLLAAPPDDLAAAWREIAGIEVAVLRGTLAGEDLRQKLLAPPAGAPLVASGYAWYYRLERLVLGGWVGDLPAALRAADGQLAPGDSARLLLLAYAATGDDAARVRAFQTFLQTHPRPSDAELALWCSHLIRHPQPELLKALGSVWASEGRPPDAERVGIALALYCAAAAGQDESLRRTLADWLRQAAGGQLPEVLELLAVALRTPENWHKINQILPSLPPLPLEVIYALQTKQKLKTGK
jgi:hypothetical protein